MSISDVPREFAPMQLPRELDPAMLLTIQPTGVRFDQPVPIVFPNTDNLAPNSETDIYSLDPDTGQFTIVGRGRVTADGAMIETISGGVRSASWHATLPPPPQPSPDVPDNNAEVSQPEQEAQCQIGSSVGLQGGCLSIRHALPAYRSFDESRGLELFYRSQSANPVPVLNVDTNLDPAAAQPIAFAAELMRVGGVGQDFRVFSEAGSDTLRQAVRFDARDFPTGRYGYSMMLDSQYPQSAVGSQVSGTVLVDNQINSPVGAGWRLNATSRLIETQGEPLLMDRTGALLRFNRFESDGGGTGLFPSAERFATGDTPPRSRLPISTATERRIWSPPINSGDLAYCWATATARFRRPRRSRRVMVR